jgi:hypothetical protein
MKRWVIVTDGTVRLEQLRGQVQAAQLPSPDRYDVDDCWKSSLATPTRG